MMLGVAGFYGLAALGVQAAISSFVPLEPAHASDPVPARVSMDGLPVESLRAPSKIDYERVDQRLTRLAEKRDMVGVAVAIIENGEIAFVKGYGVTTAGTTDPVGVRTVFRWASLSKGLAATVVGELAAEKRLSLSDPVSRYAPSLHLPGGSQARVTLDDLLAHRVGLVHNAYDDRLEDGQDPHLIRTALGALSPYCAPGQCHGYQNVAFDAASEAVETVTGERYADVVREKLFAPLGMADASVSRDGLMRAASWARPHVGRTTVKVDDAYYRVPAAGGVNSSIFDMALWMRAQMGLATGVVPQSVLDEIHRARVNTERRNGDFSRAMGQSQYALGWRDYHYAGHRLIGHQGAVEGYRSTILFDPATKSGVAVLWNSQSNRPSAFQLEILEMLYGQERHDWLKLDENRPGGARIAAR